jgi:hypothetical protein
MFFADDAMDVPPPTPAQAERSAWLELVASLRQDIERLKAEREPVAATPAAADTRQPATPIPTHIPAPAVTAPPPTPTRSRRPVEDQWGLFDPEQCGFAALLAKLDEIGARDNAAR